MTPYQLFLLVVLVLWPAAIMGLLFLMARLERYESRAVRIRFGDRVVGEPEG